MCVHDFFIEVSPCCSSVLFCVICSVVTSHVLILWLDSLFALVAHVMWQQGRTPKVLSSPYTLLTLVTPRRGGIYSSLTQGIT